jgi:hypothetical protein
MRYDRLWLPASLIGVLATAGPPAHAAIAYSQNFNTGTASFTVDNPYWLDQGGETNDYIVQNSSAVPGFSDTITNDASGSGFFLFEGTTHDPPTGATEFFISPSFSVTPNAAYTVSFELANQNNSNIAQIQPAIGGTLLGSPVSAAGPPPDTDWQTLSFTWNSGASTTASLILNDFQTQGFGNDFGIDNILVATAAIPEPATLLVLTAGVAGLLGSRRRRAK